jgi:hypothetical protein
MTNFGKRTPLTALGERAISSRMSSKTVSHLDHDLDTARVREAPERGKPPFWRSDGSVSLALLSILFAGLLYAEIRYNDIELVRDIWLAGTWEPAPDMRIIDNKCELDLNKSIGDDIFFLRNCAVVIEPRSGQSWTGFKSRFKVAFTTVANMPALPVRSRLDPTAIAVNYAVNDLLLNRILTSFVLMGSYITVLIALVTRLFKGEY